VHCFLRVRSCSNSLIPLASADLGFQFLLSPFDLYLPVGPRSEPISYQQPSLQFLDIAPIYEPRPRIGQPEIPNPTAMLLIDRLLDFSDLAQISKKFPQVWLLVLDQEEKRQFAKG